MNFKIILSTALISQLVSVSSIFARESKDTLAFKKDKEKHIFIDKNDDDVIKLRNILASPNEPEVSDISFIVQTSFGLFSNFSYHGKNNKGESVDKKLSEWFRNGSSLSSLYLDGIQGLEKKTELSKFTTKKFNFDVLLQKKLNLFGSNSSFFGELNGKETEVKLNKLYIENSSFRFGKNESLFEGNTDTVWGLFYVKKFDNGIALNLGFEEFNSPEKIPHAKTEKDNEGSNDHYTFFTNTEKVSYSFAPKFSYTNDKVSCSLAGLGTFPLMRYENRIDAMHFYLPLYGVNFYSKFIVNRSDFLEKKNKDIINVGVKYAEGMSQYITECDLPAYNGIDFCVKNQKKTHKFISSKILAASLGFMHVWSNSLSSKLNISGFYILGSDKKESLSSRKSSVRWYDNAGTIKLLPLSYTISQVFKIEPSYVCKIGNVLMKKGFASGDKLKMIHSAGLSLSYDIKVI